MIVKIIPDDIRRSYLNRSHMTTVVDYTRASDNSFILYLLSQDIDKMEIYLRRDMPVDLVVPYLGKDFEIEFKTTYRTEAPLTLPEICNLKSFYSDESDFKKFAKVGD